jgi:RNA polymerase sigma-70 factor, ECF subfamily
VGRDASARGGGLAGGDAVARFERLYTSHHRDLLRYVLRRLDRPDQAADVVAETFLAAWRRIDEVPSGREARPWLFGVARRAMANQRRGSRRRDALVDRLGRELAAVTVTWPAAPGTSLAQVGELFRALPDTDREVLTLAAWESLGTADIAVVLGCSPTAARLRLHRARRRFARALRAADVDIGVRAAAPPPALQPATHGTGTGR